MSTRSIKEALDWLENYLGHEPEAQAARRRARTDVESIERAAREFSEHGEDARSSAWELMERIAKDSASVK